MTKKILLAEDEEDLRNLVKIYLESYDLEIIEAGDGEKAVELAKQHKPDLILLDNNMPGLSGYEVIQKIKSIPEVRKIPIVMVTGKKFDAQMQAMIKMDAQDFISKPYEEEKIIQTITKILGPVEKKAVEEVFFVEEDKSAQDLTSTPETAGFLQDVLQDDQPKANQEESLQEKSQPISSEINQDVFAIEQSEVSQEVEVQTREISNISVKQSLTPETNIDKKINLEAQTPLSDNLQKSIPSQGISTGQEEPIFDIPPEFSSIGAIKPDNFSFSETKQEKTTIKKDNINLLEKKIFGIEDKVVDTEKKEKQEEVKKGIPDLLSSAFDKHEPVIAKTQELKIKTDQTPLDIEEKKVEEKIIEVEKETEQEEILLKPEIQQEQPKSILQDETELKNIPPEFAMIEGIESTVELEENVQSYVEPVELEKKIVQEPVKEDIKKKLSNDGVYILTGISLRHLYKIMFKKENLEVCPEYEGKPLILLVGGSLEEEILAKVEKVSNLFNINIIVVESDTFNICKDTLKENNIKKIEKSEIANLKDVILKLL